MCDVQINPSNLPIIGTYLLYDLFLVIRPVLIYPLPNEPNTVQWTDKLFSEFLFKSSNLPPKSGIMVQRTVLTEPNYYL